ncbi:MAG: hypothetical protein KatS3mg061_0151 [Dehalococcoidia bacterium]|nr:MAG: hypothetical protein KatS3mg061_0151 [Dehalococcoidia bacterium]
MAESNDEATTLAARAPDPGESAGFRRVELHLLEETYQAAQELIAAEHWSEEAGLLTIFAAGLAFLRGERELAQLSQGEPALRAEVNRLLQRLVACEGQYAVMKFRAFSLKRDNRVLEMHEAGLRGENELSRVRLEQFRRQESQLRAELARLQAENERLRRAQPLASASPQQPTREGGVRSGFRRLLRNLGARFPTPRSCASPSVAPAEDQQRG